MEPPVKMFEFFGTSADSYQGGILARIRREISADSAAYIQGLLEDEGSRGEDFCIVYPSRRGDGKCCEMQLNAYAREPSGDGWIYDMVEMDITDLVEAQRNAAELTENMDQALLDIINHLPANAMLFRIRSDGVASARTWLECKLLGSILQSSRPMIEKDQMVIACQKSNVA